MLRIQTFGAREQVFFRGYIRPSSTDPLDETWIPALNFFCRGVTVARPTMTKPTLISVLKKAQKYANCTADRPTCLVGMSYSRQQHIANIAGGVIGGHAALFWQCSWPRQKMGITIALKPGVTSGVPNTLYVEFQFQRRQTNVSQTMRPTLIQSQKWPHFVCFTLHGHFVTICVILRSCNSVRVI